MLLSHKLSHNVIPVDLFNCTGQPYKHCGNMSQCVYKKSMSLPSVFKGLELFCTLSRLNSVTIIAIFSQPHENIISLLLNDVHYGAATGCWISIKVTYQPFIFHVEMFVC